MNDEVFHLTPVDVRRFEFGTQMRGYDKARVDQFREQVADELERMARLNQELESKARGFHEQLRAFRERDKALNEALVSAQQMRAETKEQAEREGQLIVREAQADADKRLREAQHEADRLIEAARVEVRKLERQVDGLERLRRSFIVQMKKMAEHQLAELAAAEQVPLPARPTPIDASEPVEAEAAPAQAE
ncbi:MAG TPA: DivIVA domain-containing protein, partial [Gemmatimonadaceae bacterium]|nr:DivIVA domain-containing protein [Gemmatimonadaceae bacterium]